MRTSMGTALGIAERVRAQAVNDLAAIHNRIWKTRVNMPFGTEAARARRDELEKALKMIHEVISDLEKH